MSVLDDIVAVTRAEVERRKREEPLAPQPAHSPGRPFASALRGPGLALVAEHKRRSPSAGVLRAGASVAEIVGAYERGGAAALSILTDGPHFDGSLADLRAARTASALPLLRKDFIVDLYQLDEALAAGADAVLLIVAALAEPELRALYAEAQDRGLDTLVEVHDRAELDAALDAGADLVGINNRDLADFSLDVARTHELLEHVPAGTAVVAESGFSTRAELAELERAGVAGVLIGETLMRAADVEATCRALARPSARAGNVGGAFSGTS